MRATRLGHVSRWATGVLLWALVASGCGSSYAQLKDLHAPGLVDAGDEHACALCEPCAEHAGAVLYSTWGARGIEARIGISEVAPPRPDDAPRTIILIHGVFSDCRAWQFMLAPLARDARVVLVDLPGCGESDTPALSRDDEADVYSPDAMAYRLAEALTAHFDSRPAGLGKAMVVAHSLGGLVTLRLMESDAIRDAFPALLDRIDRLVLIAPFDGVAEKADPLFLSLERLGSFQVGVGMALGTVRERVAAGVLRSVVDPSDALRCEADCRIEMLTNPQRRRALQAILRNVVPLEAGATEFRPDWERMSRVSAAHTGMTRPTLIIWGERDETLPVSMGYKLWSLLPRSELRVFDRCKHSPHIEEPAACADLIREFADQTDIALRRPPGLAPGVDIQKLAGRRSPTGANTGNSVEGGR